MNRSLAVADCETDPFRIGRVPKPFAWGYYNGETYREFWGDTSKFIRFLKKQAVICYAHNGGKFDWHFVLDEFAPYSDIMIINGRIARCYIGMAECRDSYNIIPVPLSTYKKDEIDYRIMEPEEREKPENRVKISAYLKSDCVYLYELVAGFAERYGVQLTQAGAAMNQWKKVSKADVPDSGKKFYQDFSPYYYGGRVQCFKSGIIEKNFAVYDINSAYPFAMLQKHPYSTDYMHVMGYAKNADFYKVRCVSHGAFPFRGMGDPGKAAGLWFPHDSERREYTVTGWEYQAAKDTDTISRPQVVESYLFQNRIDFADYINRFYELRLKAKAEGNEAESLFAKLLMNSLYGKFAANPENYRNYMVVPMDVIGGLEAAGWAFAGEIGPWGLAEAPLYSFQERYYNVATGASITGFVRAMLWRAVCASRGVLYCDTDSIAVIKRGKAITLKDDLGAWKHEGDFDRAGIAGKKLYIFRGVPDAKGKREYKTASKGARLTHSQLWTVARGGNVLFQSDVPTFSVTSAPVFTDRRIKKTA